MTMIVLEKMTSRFLSASICIIIGFLSNPVAAGSYCYKTSSSYGISSFTSQYCDYGCCYEYTSSPCCSIDIGLIVGAVIGSLVGLALLISLICIVIHCSKAHTKRSTMVGPQVFTTSTQIVQPMGYQPYYQASVTAYPVYPAYPGPSAGQPINPPPYNPPAAEPLPPPIYVEGTRPPADHQNK